MIRLSGGRVCSWSRLAFTALIYGVVLLAPALSHAAPPDAGGDILATTTGGGALSITEDTATPTDFRVSGITLNDSDGGTPTQIRLISVNGGTVTTSANGPITLGEKPTGTILTLTGSMIDLKFVPTPNRATNATISYKVVDPEGPAADSSASTITIAITSVDDIPDAGGNILATTTGGGALSIAEDTLTPTSFRVSGINLNDDDGGTPTQIRLISVDGGTVTTSADGAITLGEKPTGTALTLAGSMIDLKFVPAPDRATNATISYKVVDPEGPAADSAASTITITISAVNDPPQAGGNILATTTGGGALSILEDTATPTDFRVSGINLSDVDGGTPSQIRLISVNGGTVTTSANGPITLGEKPTGTVLTLTGSMIDLKFVPTPNRATNATISYKVVDPEGPAADSAASTITIAITSVDDIPAAGGNILATTTGGAALSIAEDTLTPTSFRVSGINLNDNDGGTPTQIRLISVDGGTVTTSADGAITLGEKPTGTALTLAGSMIDLKFVPAPDRATNATISYKVVDPEGPAADSAASTITITISAVNDPPQAGGNILATTTGGGALSIVEDTATPTDFRVSGINLSDVDGGTPTQIRLISVTGGTVTTSGNGPITLGDKPTGTTLTLTGTMIDLKFVPTPNRSTNASISYKVVDPEGPAADSASSTITIAITATDDPPNAGGSILATTTGGGPLSIVEDTATPTDFRVSGIIRVDVDGGTPSQIRLISVSGGTVTTSANGPITLGEKGVGTALTLSGSMIDLKFVPSADRDTNAAISYKVVDPEGPAADSAPSTITITITAVNDAPAISDGTLANINEDDTNPPGATLTTLFSGSFVDPDGTFFGVAVVSNAALGTTGKWQYNPPSGNVNDWYDIGIVNDIGLALVLRADTKVRFLPASEFDGAVTAITVRPLDNNHPSGSFSNKVMGSESRVTLNTSTNGDPTAIGDTARAINTNVVGMNDTPTVATNTTLTVNQGSSAFITSARLAATDSDDVDSTLLFTVTSGPINGTLNLTPTFTQANISANGVSYTHNGSATTSDSFTFNVRDDENATSTPDATFNITINRTPTVSTPIADVQVNENAGDVLISLLTSFTDAESGAGGLTYTVQGTTGDAIFNGTPAIETLSNLRIRFAADSPGTNMVTIRATDPGGAFVEDTFQVSVNDKPFADDDAASTSEGNAVAITVLTGDTDSDGTIDPTTVTITGAAGRGATSVHPATGVVTYTPTGDLNGADSFMYTVKDNLGATSNVATVTITVSAVNDAPALIVPGAQSVAEGGSLSISTLDGNAITISDVDADETPFAGGVGGVDVTLKALNGTLTLASTTGLANVVNNGTAMVSFDGTIASTANALNGLVYAPNALFNGMDTITVTVDDTGNTGSGVTAKPMGTIAVTVSSANDPPVVTVPGPNTVNEDILTAITGVSIADPDANSGNVTTVLSVGQGTITVNASAVGGVPPGQVTNNNTNSVTLLGTVSQSNITLATLRFQTALNIVTGQTLTVAVNDGGNSGGPAETDSKTIAITVTPQNDAPTFTIFPTAQTVNEDTIRQFSTANGNRITVADVDHLEGNPTGTIQTTLTVINGKLTLNGTAGLTVTGNTTGTVVATGSATNLNTALNGMSYLGNQHFNGGDTLTVALNDGGNTGAGPVGTASMNTSITVNAVNDDPVINVPPAQNPNENTNFPFSVLDGNAITITDVDAIETPGDLDVTLTVSNGILTLADTAGLTTFSTNGTASVGMTGAVAAINAALDGLIYRANQDYNGADTLNISTDDNGNTGSGGGGTINGSVAIVVDAVNNAPSLTVPGTQTINEDTTAGIVGIAVSDVDAAGGNLKVTLSVVAGIINVTADLPGGVDTLDISGNGSREVILTGTLGELNTTLPTLTFRSAQNNANSQTLTVLVSDQGFTGDGGPKTDTKNIPINIVAQNDDPVILVPAAQTTNEEALLSFASGGGNPITITDVDVAESVPGELTVSLSVSHGRLSLSSTSGLTVSAGTGFNDIAMTFSGTPTNINNALEGFSYRPDLDFNTESGLTEALQIVVIDSGGTGLGGGGNITSSVVINVIALNDDPVLNVPAAQTVNEDTPLPFTGTISVSDIDVAESAGSLSLTLSALSGTVTLAQTTGLTITAPANGTSDATITFTGTATAINSALNGLFYQGNQDFNGSDTLTLTLNDQGNTGVGGGTNIVRTIAITVAPINDPPVASALVLSPAEPLRNEDLTATYTYFDVDGDSESGTTIRWFRNGSLQSAFNDLATVPMSATIEEEVWFFRVTPSDGLLPGAEVQSNSVSIRPVADLQIFISRSPSQVVPGENVSYTFQVRNLGPSPVTGAMVTSTLPATLQNVTWTCSACGTSGVGNLNEIVDLSNGQTVEYVITALVDASGTGDLIVSGAVSAPALVFETNASNNTATNTVPLMPEANLNVTMSASQTTAAPGDAITYTVTATNNGPSDARGVFFNDVPDIYTKLIADNTVTTSRGTIVSGSTAGDTEVTANVGTLALGASVQIVYSVLVDNPFPAQGLSMVCTRGKFFGEAGNPDVNFVDAEPVADSCTTILSTITISATKVDALLIDVNGNRAINPGDTIRYTVALENTGNGGANGLTYSHPAIANGTLNQNSITTTPTAQSISLNGSAVTINLGSIEGSGGAVSGANKATITFDVIVVNPLPPGAGFLVSQGSVTYDELPSGTSPTRTNDPDAVDVGDTNIVPVDDSGNVLRPAPTATPIIASPSLVVRLSDGIARNEEKRPGDTIRYTATIENAGNRGAANLVYRNPFRDNEISEIELQSVEGASPLIDVATSLLSNFNALDVDSSDGLSASELDGSFFALTTAQFNELDTSDARLSLLPDSILVNGLAAANVGTENELELELGNLNGRNPLLTNGPTLTINFTVLLEDVLQEGINAVRSQGVVESDVLAPVRSDDPETINIAADATVTFVRAIPDITIVPEILTIDFGDQDIDDGQTPARMVEISNGASATANLALGFVGLEGAGLSEFVIVSDTRETVLEPGKTRFIQLAFDPDSIGNKRASLRIESDDPDDSAVDVNLSGRALDSDIRVTPSTLNFGKRNLLAGPSSPQSVSIINDGLGILTLDSVTLACGPDIFPVMTQARFAELDRNGDGVLTAGIGRIELEQAIDLFDIAETLIDDFDDLDLDNSNNLTAIEVEERFPFLTEARFAVLDADTSLGLSQAELSRSIALAAFAESLLDSFSDFDTNPPVGLDFTESQQILPDLTQAEFTTLDTNKDGVLSIPELEERRKLASIAMQLNTDFLGLDLNRNSALSLSEISSFTPLSTPGRFRAIDADSNDEITVAELSAVSSTLAESVLSSFDDLDSDNSGGLTLGELSASCDFEILSDSGETALETAQSRLVRVVFNPSTTGMKVGTLRIEANQQGQGTPIVSKVTLFGTGNRTPRIVDQNPVSTMEDTPVTIILDNLIVDAPLLDFPREVTLAFQPLPAGANYRRDGNVIIPNLNFNGVLLVPVTVRDGIIDSNVWNLRIDVARVNDPPTGINLDNNTISENQVLNTVIGRLRTADPDLGDLHIYSLVEDDPTTDDDDFIDNEFFGIVADQLVSRVVFDFETRDTYTVMVRSRDPGGQTINRAFNIVILDQANDEDNSVASEVLLNNFDDVDSNEDGSLSLEEVLVVLPGFTEERFNALNVESEVSEAELQVGIDSTEAAQRLFDNFELADVNKDGGLNLSEARTQVSGLSRQSFRFLDLDLDGVLTPSELQTGILLHTQLSALLASFSTLDKDGSGQLTFDEVPTSASALTRERFNLLETDPGVSRRELETRVTCMLTEGSVALIQPTGDLLAPPTATLLDVSFNAEVDVNVGIACSANDVTFSYDIGAESILITDLAEYFLQNFVALDADFNGGLAYEEVSFSRMGITAERFAIIDFDGDEFLVNDELEAAVVLSDFAGVLLDDFASLNTDNSTGLSFAETQAAGVDLDTLRYNIIDLNNDGVLTRQELEAELDLPGYLLRRFADFDANDDDGLTLDEVGVILPGLSTVRFENIDADADGFLIAGELEASDDFGKQAPVFATPLPLEGVQKQLRGLTPATFTLPVNNAYRIRVTARLDSTGQTVQSEEFTFEIRNGVDDDRNGYLDAPFADLTSNGARWQDSVASVNCNRAVVMHYWQGANIPGRAIEVSLKNPAKPTQKVDLLVPHGLLNEGEEGILIVSMACDGGSLFTRQQVEALEAFPDDLVVGSPWIDISVVVRKIGESDFSPISNSRLAQRPIDILLNQLTFSPEDLANFYRHGALVVDAPETGFTVVPGQETWSAEASRNVAMAGSTLRARLIEIGVVVALESLKPPILVTTPDSASAIDFGEVPVNVSVEKSVTITNLGGEQLVGTVELRDATGTFTIVGEASYSLAHGETHTFLVRFAPREATSFAGAITYSGDKSGLITAQVNGVGLAPKGFGCGPAPAGGPFPLGNNLIILLTLAVLLAHHGRSRAHGKPGRFFSR